MRVIALALCTAAAVGGAWALLRWRERPPEVTGTADAVRESPPLLVQVTESAGVDFFHETRTADPYFSPNIMSPGCALLDFDQDGVLDLFLVNGGGEEGKASLAGSNRLYRQERTGRFVDVTSGSGLESTAFGMGVAVGDVNNDGLPDLYVTNYGPDRLYLNRGNGRFSNVTEAAGIDNARWAASACFLDYDRDGWLDLYVTNYVDYFESKQCGDATGAEDFCGPQAFSGTVDKLFRNVTGESAADDQASVRVPRFSDETVRSGIAEHSGPGLGVLSADFNGDRWPDLYVANDGAPNWLWVNQRDGTFRDEAVLRGCATDMLGRSQAGMGVALGDLDEDGHSDLVVTHLAGEMNALYWNRGSLGFEEDSISAGLGAVSFPYTGFGIAMMDIEHDGDLDLLVVNGRVKRPTRDASGPAPSGDDIWQLYAEPNQIFVNERGAFRLASGETFSDPLEVSRGLAVGDIDGDGDLDGVVTNSGDRTRVYRNDAPKLGSWLLVRAVEPNLGGRDAYGAVVTVIAGERRWLRHVNPAFSYLSSSDPRVHFGVGELEKFDRIEVIWPDGSEEIFPGGRAGRVVTVEHGRGEGR